MFSNNAPTDQNSSLFGNNPSEANSFSHDQVGQNPFGSQQPVVASDNRNAVAPESDPYNFFDYNNDEDTSAQQQPTGSGGVIPTSMFDWVNMGYKW